MRRSIPRVFLMTFGVQLSLSLGLAASAGAEHSEKSEKHLTPHQHGTGQINVVMEENRFVLSLVLALSDLVDFEHRPKTSEEKIAIDRAIARFKNHHNILKIPQKADCKLMDRAHVACQALKGGGHEHWQEWIPHSKHHPQDLKLAQLQSKKMTQLKKHLDLEVSYIVECGAIQELKSIEVEVFKIFPKVKSLKGAVVKAVDFSEVSQATKDLVLTAHNNALQF